MTATVTETDSLDKLDFDPTCEFEVISPEVSHGRCPNVAKWVAVHTCPSCDTSHKTLTCDRCKVEWDNVSHKYAMRCTACGAVSPVVTNWEKL